MYSNPEKFHKMCLRKKRLSEAIADKIIKKAKSEGSNLYKYYCPYCFCWHLTKKPNNNIIQENRIKKEFVYFIRTSNRKIYKMTKNDYDNSKKNKNCDIFITEGQFMIIPKNKCHLVFTKEYPNVKSIIKFINKNDLVD